MAKRKAALFRIVIFLLVAGVGIGGLLLLREKRFQQPVLDFLQWARAHQIVGACLLALVYVLACVVLVPGSLITLGAGFAFGVGVGFVTVYAGSNLGAMAAFLLGRTLARSWIERRVAAIPRFRAIDQAVVENGFKMVLLLRLSPIFPFNFLNYALGLTRVRFRDYCLATLLGMVPGILMYVYLGSLITDVTELVTAKSERSPAEKLLFYAGLACTLVVTILITKTARQALAAAVPKDSSATPVAQGDQHG